MRSSNIVFLVFLVVLIFGSCLKKETVLDSSDPSINPTNCSISSFQRARECCNNSKYQEMDACQTYCSNNLDSICCDVSEVSVQCENYCNSLTSEDDRCCQFDNLEACPNNISKCSQSLKETSLNAPFMTSNSDFYALYKGEASSNLDEYPIGKNDYDSGCTGGANSICANGYPSTSYGTISMTQNMSKMCSEYVKFCYTSDFTNRGLLVRDSGGGFLWEPCGSDASGNVDKVSKVKCDVWGDCDTYRGAVLIQNAYEGLIVKENINQITYTTCGEAVRRDSPRCSDWINLSKLPTTYRDHSNNPYLLVNFLHNAGGRMGTNAVVWDWPVAIPFNLNSPEIGGAIITFNFNQ